ncbi:MAG: hypothetical protein HKN27_00665 [Silicimonas sp.]|nr:hypothetical protein [Silicimonas sp.]
MDALALVLQLVFRSFVVLLPVLVGALAFRRLAKSKTSNAWIYAVTCLFAAVTTAGLLPWAVGMDASSWVFFVLAAFCPAIWFGVTTTCDTTRKRSYKPEVDDFSSILFKTRLKKAEPLVLENPIKDMPTPVFAHKTPANTDAPSVAAAPEEKPKPISEKSVLDVAREMRRNRSTDERRPKLLPSPSVAELPFIKTSGTA